MVVAPGSSSSLKTAWHPPAGKCRRVVSEECAKRTQPPTGTATKTARCDGSFLAQTNLILYKLHQGEIVAVLPIIDEGEGLQTMKNRFTCYLAGMVLVLCVSFEARASTITNEVILSIDNMNLVGQAGSVVSVGGRIVNNSGLEL